MKGRKPVPTALKILRGNPGQRPLNTDEPIPDALAERVPGELEAAEARREWKRTIVPAIRRGQITAADRACAIAHCDLWATWRDELTAADRAAAHKTLRLLLTFDAEIGFTPVSRSRVKVATPATAKAPSKWAGLLA